MTPESNDLQSRARAYVEASNAHDLQRIAPMFAADATYTSSRTGTFAGVPEIIAMMAGFFGQFGDAAWHTENWRVVDGDGVAFDFVLTAGGSERSGVERIFFDSQGLIGRIEIES